MLLFFVSIVFITFSFVVGYLHGLRTSRSLAKSLATQATTYTIQCLAPYLSKDFKLDQALDRFEEELKQRGELPRDFKSKGAK